ncbi:DMT family transporter [Rhodococcus wratislaviensis]|uniref:DMT family transporter n=1 Tax=Rhodococcus wratislaviensis TaxID=44752 RepID=UPI0036486432
MAWVFLIGAIVAELVGTLSLKVSATGHKLWFVTVAVGYIGAFALLSEGLSRGLNLGVAYGIWAAAGVALATISSKILFKEPLTPFMASGIALIIGGVLLVELGAGQ